VIEDAGNINFGNIGLPDLDPQHSIFKKSMDKSNMSFEKSFGPFYNASLHLGTGGIKETNPFIPNQLFDGKSESISLVRGNKQ
jgi:hypothetical protein